MHLIPVSLFGRLTLVLLPILLAGQLLGAVILLQDRGRAVYEAGGLHAAQRIAGVVQLLETLDLAKRAAILRAVDTEGFRVALVGPPASLDPADNHAQHLRTMVQQALGGARPVAVAVLGLDCVDHPKDGRVSATDCAHGHGAPHIRAFRVQLRLQDGQWVSFTQQLQEALFVWPLRLLLTLGVLLASVILVSLIAVRAITRPLTTLSAAAEALGRDIGRAPLSESGPRELQQAAQAFNAMQLRLRRYLHERERLLAAISHDLMTPVTRLRLRAELLDDEALKHKFVRDLDEMKDMVFATIEFLRTAYEREPVQPTDINALIESLQADREEMGQSVTIAGAAHESYAARPTALKRLLANLIDNAIKYGECAMVRVEDTAACLRIVVGDKGSGIPEERLEEVFEPFHRLESSRSRDTGGVGLGLSIARDIAHAHGGELTLRNREGGGLDAVLTLPRAAG